MPGACPPGSSSPSKRGHVQVRPRDGGAELRCLGELFVEPLGFVLGAELPEEDAGQQPGVRSGSGPGMLGGEDDLVPGVGEQPPGHGDLGDVEVAVGDRHQHAHAAIMAAGS
jgi:hypothetical protein